MKVGLTFSILAFLYRRGMLDFSRVRSTLGNPAIFATCMALQFSTSVASMVRWRLLLLGQGIKISFFETFRLTMIGTFFNTAIPGAVSGDLVKGYYVVRQQPDGRGRIKAFTTLLLDRLLGLSALVCVSFVAMAANLQSSLAIPGLKSLCGLISALWLGVVFFYAFVLVEWSFTKPLLKLLRKLPAGTYFVKLFEAVKAYENCPGYVIKGLLISLAIHTVSITVMVLLARSLGTFNAVAIDKFFFLIPFGLLVTAIPVAPAGLGTGHGAFYLLFKKVGSSAGADLFTAFVSFQLLISLFGGLFYMRYRLTSSKHSMDSI